MKNVKIDTKSVKVKKPKVPTAKPKTGRPKIKFDDLVEDVNASFPFLKIK